MASFSDIQRVVNGEGHFAPYNHITVTRIENREAEGTLEIRSESLNPMGIVHGGALVALADTVCGVAAWSSGRVCVTLDCSMQYLAPGTGKTITCVATPKKLGRTILVYDAALTDDTGRLVATGTYTFFAKEQRVEDTEIGK